MSRPPSYQHYPDKWVSGTRHLSDSAYRIYHEILNWMWLHSPDFSSISQDFSAIQIATGFTKAKIGRALQQIQNPYMPLFKVEDNRFVSNALRKEYARMKKRKDQAKEAARARWGHMPKECVGNADASIEQSLPTPTPTSTPSSKTKKTKRRFNPLDIPLPDHLQDPSVKDAWDGYLEVRREKKFTMTERAINLLIGKLKGLTALEAVLALNDSIEKGWKSIYPKEETTGNQRPTRGRQNAAELAAMFAQDEEVTCE